MALLSISSEWTEVQVRKSPLHFCLSPSYQAHTDASRCSHRMTHPVAHAHQVPAAIWSFLELFGEWGGTWTLLLNLTALVVLLNYQMALCAQKGHRGLREASTRRKQSMQKKRKVSLQLEDQGDVEMQV